jgi:F0F1-type ATP synthase membrane subunit b/b'
MTIALIISILVNIALFIYLVKFVKIKQYYQDTRGSIDKQLQDYYELQRLQVDQVCMEKMRELDVQRQLVLNNYQTDADSIRQKNSELIEQQKQQKVQRAEVEIATTIDFFKRALEEQITQKTDQYYSICDDIEKAIEELTDYHSKQQAIIEQLKQAEAIKQEDKFYRMQLSASDIVDLYWLRQIADKLNNKEVLNKVIYKVYYEKALTNLVGRIIGSSIKCGIYKITNIENGMCYIGQSVNIAERWKQHTKRALGCEPITQNKLYPVMSELGPENFTWQIVEECSREKLNEREKYWQEFYGAQEFGYSIK